MTFPCPQEDGETKLVRMIFGNRSDYLAGLPALERQTLGPAIFFGFERFFAMLAISFDPFPQILMADSEELCCFRLCFAIENIFDSLDSNFFLCRRC